MEFRVLGLLEVLDAGRTVELRGRKARAVLAMLLMRPGEVVSADRLAEGLWGDDQPSTAAATLQVYVSHLRKALGPEAIRTRSPGYVLAVAPDQVDAGRFEELVARGRALLGDDPGAARALLAEALALWRGPALADFTSEDFARAEAARLEELRLVAVEERAEADLALGHHAELVAHLRGLVDEHPLRERLWAQLVLALYRSGRQAEALRAATEVRRVLGEELGIEPGPALRQLEARVLAQDPALDLPSAAGSPPASPSPGLGAYLEIRAAGPPELFTLDRPRVTIGRGTGNDVCLSDDRLVSETHAVLELYGASFSVRDLGSSNGTFVNGRRLAAEQALRPGDRIELGRTVLVYRRRGNLTVERTEKGPEAPALTGPERDVILALCRPLADPGLFSAPASIGQIAEELGVDESAVKFHLANLYDKFGITATAQSRRLVLANEAVRRRAVTVADLR